MLDDLPTNIEATLLRPRIPGADGVPHIEQPHDPDTWRDADADLVALGRGTFTVLLADDRATLAQIDGESEAMAMRARFEPLAGCPEPRMGDTLAVSLGGVLAIAFEVMLTSDDLAAVTPRWHLFVADVLQAGQVLIELNENLGTVVV